MAAWRRPDWKAGNTRERPPPPRFSAPLPARKPCSGLCGMSIGMTTDKTARASRIPIPAALIRDCRRAPPSEGAAHARLRALPPR